MSVFRALLETGCVCVCVVGFDVGIIELRGILNGRTRKVYEFHIEKSSFWIPNLMLSLSPN